METEQLSIRGVRERRLVLRSLDVLSGLDDAGYTLLAEQARERHFRPGDVILRSDDPIESVYLVVSGRVEVQRLEQVIGHVGHGRGLGILSMLARDPEGIDAVAETMVAAIEIPVRMFLNAYEENFSLLRNSLRVASEALMRDRRELPVPPGAEPEVELGDWRDEEPTLVERVILARQLPLFARVNLDAVIELCRRMEEVRYGPGETIWDIGDRGLFNCRINYGRVRCENSSGDRVTVGADYMVGAWDVLGDLNRRYSAVTETEVITAQISQSAMMSVLETHLELAMDLLAMVCGQLLDGYGA